MDEDKDLRVCKVKATFPGSEPAKVKEIFERLTPNKCSNRCPYLYLHVGMHVMLTANH